jgi:hypothetical protein
VRTPIRAALAGLRDVLFTVLVAVAAGLAFALAFLWLTRWP